MNIFQITSICIAILFISCNKNQSTELQLKSSAIIILGTAQDAGSPHMNCRKSCCIDLWNHASKKTNVVSLAIYDNELEQTWLFEATPDIAPQLNKLKELTENNTLVPSGVFLTHAHIGHYTGLMHFGKEAMGAKQIPVFAMPQMKLFLETNGPWSQLVKLKNITLNKLHADSNHVLSNNLTVKPILVPHRDEFSETVGYYIQFKDKKIMFIPDIDKWEKWNKNITKEIKKVDFAFIDATLFDNKELPNRDMSEIPHPFVVESMELLKDLAPSEKNKVYFIHFNHSNPLLKVKSEEYKEVLSNGYNISRQYDIIELD